MVKRTGFIFIILLFFFASFFSIIFYHLNVMAQDLEEDANKLIDEYNGYFSTLEEDEEDTDKVLSDNQQYLKDLNNDYDETEIEENNQEVYKTLLLYENLSENEEDMINNDDQYKVMIIFCFGLLSGVIVGQVLLGFIK